MALAQEMGLSSDDPLYLFSIQLGHFESLVLNAPQEWEAIFTTHRADLRQWQDHHQKTLETSERMTDAIEALTRSLNEQTEQISALQEACEAITGQSASTAEPSPELLEQWENLSSRLETWMHENRQDLHNLTATLNRPRAETPASTGTRTAATAPPARPCRSPCRIPQQLKSLPARAKPAAPSASCWGAGIPHWRDVLHGIPTAPESMQAHAIVTGPAWDMVKNVGFTVFHGVGWVAYLPLVGVVLLFYAVLVCVLGVLLKILLSYVDVDGIDLILGSIYTTASLVAWLLSRLGMRVGFDPASIRSIWQVPGMLIRSIFTLIRPNRLTFLLGCAATAYFLPILWGY